jgi:hypothetical protein
MLSQANNDELQPTADAAAAERGRSMRLTVDRTTTKIIEKQGRGATHERTQAIHRYWCVWLSQY